MAGRPRQSCQESGANCPQPSAKATSNQKPAFKAEPAKSTSNGSAKSSRELQEVESRITTLEKELAQYEAQLADPGIYSNAAQLKDATLKFEQVQKELTLQTKRWEELV
ncbi:hypothetical protein G7064_05845 [Hymenobacter sp. HDW8]|nr:hypothetical protein G7064_05845 [Hymenobacter sp. HDW8]